MDGARKYPACECGRIYVPTKKSPSKCLACFHGRVAVPDLKDYQSDMFRSLANAEGEIVITVYVPE